MDYAVSAAAFSAFLHQGEICMSVDRVIVEEPIAEEFARARRKGGGFAFRRPEVFLRRWSAP